MIAELKQSGIKWIGCIPQHWNVMPLYGVFNERFIKNKEGKENNVLSLSYGRIVRRNIVDNFGLMPESFNTYQIVERGNIILRLTDLQNDKRSLRVGLVQEMGIISSAYVCLELKEEASSEYFFYLIHNYDIQKIFYNLGAGVRQSMGFSDLKRMPLIVPPKEEQNEIVSYIKTQSAKITRFIQTKQRFIELLNEQRQNIITNAVTKGIDDGLRMKETGVDWIGQVPMHWEIRRFKNVCLLQRGHDLSKEQFKEGEFPVYGSNGIIGYHNEYTTKSPCITIGRSGSVGEINFIEKNFWAHNTCLFVKENHNNDWEYLYYLISSIDIKLVSNGSAVPTLDRNNVHSLRVSYPPTIEEQKQIVEHIKTETKTIDIAINKAEREIELIKEYREAMIAEAVTGKMKVA